MGYLFGPMHSDPMVGALRGAARPLSVDTLADLAGVTRREADDALGRLAARGIVRAELGGRWLLVLGPEVKLAGIVIPSPPPPRRLITDDVPPRVPSGDPLAEAMRDMNASHSPDPLTPAERETRTTIIAAGLCLALVALGVVVGLVLGAQL